MDPLDLETMDAPRSIALSPVGPSLGLTIAWHADPSRVGDVSPVAAGTPVNRLEPNFYAADGRPTGPLTDPFISRSGIEITPLRAGGAQITLQGRGPLAVDGQPVNGTVQVGPGQTVLTLSRRAVLVLGPIASPRFGPDHGLVGESEAIQLVRRAIERASGISVPVLLRGPSGTGKELIARAVHAASLRQAGPYVAVNLAAVPESTAAAAFFGHTKGAFTGAGEAQPGYFGEADGGTLFLDEVGDLPAGLQPLLLRALEVGEVQPVGGRRPKTVDVRLVSATDRDLDAAVDEGEFRLPLLHRLAGYEIRVPPLAERRDDIGRLLLHFLRAELQGLGAEHRLQGDVREKHTWLSASKVSRLILDGWAGNVRALRNVARRLALDWHDVDRVASLPPLAPVPTPGPVVPTLNPGRSLDGELDEPTVLDALRAAGWAVHGAAKALGVPRTTLYDFIARTGVVPKAAELPLAQIEAAVLASDGDLKAAADALRVSRRGLGARMKALGLR